MTLIITVIAGFAGAALFEWLRVPAGALVGSMVAVASANVLIGLPTVEVPRALTFVVLGSLGTLVGLNLSRGILVGLWQQLPIIGGLVLLLLLFGALLAYATVLLGFADPASAFLATSPGGLSQMAGLAAAINANVAFVTTLHIVRTTVVIGIAPFVVRLIHSGP